MRWKIPTSVLLTLALLIPAASAAAQTGSSGPDKTICQTVMYADVRELVTIDLDTASETEVRVLANQVLAAAVADSLYVLPRRLQARLDGTADDLRAFLKTDLEWVWTTDLRIKVNQTITNAGFNVEAAAQEALDTDTIAALLAYLNYGLYVARALDSGSQPAASASV
jgi:hypothetical protein